MSTERGSRLRELFNVDADRTTATVVVMLMLDIGFWLAIFRGWVPMPGMMFLMEQGIPMTAPGAMELGAFHVGTLSSFLDYTAMWGVMMWAMMYPAMTRFTREYARALEGRLLPVAFTVATFLTGYSIVWMASAVVPLGVNAALPGGIYGFTKAHTTLTIGAVLVVTGIYQLTNFRQQRLRDCCATVTARHANPMNGFKKGIFHGVNCILVTFGVFFLVMAFFGEMNPVWMIGLVLPVALERVPTWGEEIGDATGIIALLAGVVVLVAQPTLPIGF